MRVGAGAYQFMPIDGSGPYYAMVHEYTRREFVARFFGQDGRPVASASSGKVGLVPVKIALRYGVFYRLLPEPVRDSHADVESSVRDKHHISGLPEHQHTAVQPFFECIDRESGFCELRSHADNALVRDGVQRGLPNSGERSVERVDELTAATAVVWTDIRGGIGRNHSAVLYQRNGRATGHADRSF